MDIQIHNLVKAFDSLWLEDYMHNAYDTLLSHNRDDKVALLYESNNKNIVAINTSVGVTDIVNIPKIVQQGRTMGTMPTLQGIGYNNSNHKPAGNF